MSKPFDPVVTPHAPKAPEKDELQVQQEKAVGPQSASAAPPSNGGTWPWKSDTMTGDVFGVRTALQDAGLTVQGTATLDFVNVLDGAPVNGFTMLSLIDINLTVDAEKLLGLRGATFFADFQTANQTRSPAELIPDYWGFDVINSYSSFTELAQYWYQQQIIGDRLQFKFGKIDSNVDFAVPCTGLNFVNSAAYYPSTMVQDYANPTTGQVGSNTGTNGLSTFLWENPGSYFLIAEAGPNWKIDDHSGKFRAGWFEQTGNAYTSGVNGSGVRTGAVGAYAYANQHLFDPDGDGKNLGLEVFGQFSWSDPTRNPSQWGMMLGSQWQGVIESRPNDTLGFLWAYTQFSSNETLSTSPGSSEAILEGFYNVQITPWFSFQPDIQYISQPSSVEASNIPGAWLLTVRLSFVF
jgi:porin